MRARSVRQATSAAVWVLLGLLAAGCGKPAPPENPKGDDNATPAAAAGDEYVVSVPGMH